MLFDLVTHYLTQLTKFSDYQRVYLDETGFDRYLFRPYARSLKGQIVKAQISGKRYQRLSLVSAQVGNRLIAPMVYQNTMTGVFFEAWFQQCLLPALTQKSVIILDNARFHRMGVLREMAEKLGHKARIKLEFNLRKVDGIVVRTLRAWLWWMMRCFAFGENSLIIQVFLPRGLV